MINKKMFMQSLCTFCLVVFFISQTMAQQVAYGEYPKGKIILKNGSILEGKNLVFTNQSATFTVNNATQSYQLDEITQIMIKKNKGKKGCLYGAGGCAAVALLVYVASDDAAFEEQGYESKSDATGVYFAGTALWSGIFGGIGYFVGKAMDDWKTIYLSSTQGSRDQNDLNGIRLGYQITPASILGRHIRN